MKIGDLVTCRGRYAAYFTLAGTIETITGESIGVRLTNGNYKTFPRADVAKNFSRAKEGSPAR